jgi:DegV family protein with EDD domain
MLKIVTDGSIDLPAEWQQDFGIEIIPIPIQIGGQTFLQGVDLSNDDFYRIVRETGKIPKTSLPSVGQFVEFYQRIANPGDTILSIHVSSKMSGTFNAAMAAAQELADRCSARIILFDSLSGSAALGFLCREARLLERAGSSIEEILCRLTLIRQRLSIILTLENLDFAKMSGRVSALRAALVSLLNVKPIVVLKEGLLSLGEKARTRGRALERVVDMVRQRAGEQKVNLAVVHCLDPQTGQALLARLREYCNCQVMIITELSISVAAHLGPGTVGVVVYPVE